MPLSPSSSSPKPVKPSRVLYPHAARLNAIGLTRIFATIAQARAAGTVPRMLGEAHAVALEPQDPTGLQEEHKRS
jgi:hypothetical protein